MKKLIIAILLLSYISIPTNAQKIDINKVPEIVLKSFNEKFSDAKKVSWEKENEQEWEAEFTKNKKEYSANFLENGEWLETEYEVSEKNVPKNIIKILNDNYKDSKVEVVEIVENKNGRSYEFELKINKKEIEILIDENGKVHEKKTDE